MRSRYSAFFHKNYEYLAETQDPQTRSPQDLAANKEWAENSKFLNLEIIKVDEISATKAKVEFVAQFKILSTGELHKHHEISLFRKQAGVWYFREGRTVAEKPS